MKDRVCELKCNIDDMTAEEIAYASSVFMEKGAKDVTVTPVVMKKGRPAHVLTVMCSDDDADKMRMLELIFRYTSTIGIREVLSERYILERSERVISTPYGDVRCKTAAGYGVTRSKLEYEDIARIATENSISFADAVKLTEQFL